MSGGFAYSFTATRSLRPVHVPLIRSSLADLTDGAHFYTGCARGGDTYIARVLTALFPEAHHTLLVPGWDPDSYNAELVDGWMPSATRHIVYLPRSTSARQAMRERNEALVAKAGRVCGYALYEEHRQPYSGTWMTVRMARRAGKLHRLLVLEPVEGDAARLSVTSSLPRSRNRQAPLFNS